MSNPLADYWSEVLREILDAKFEDGTSVVWYILRTNPELAKRLRDALAQSTHSGILSQDMREEWATLTPVDGIVPWETEFMAREMSSKTGHPVMHRYKWTTEWKKFE